MSRNIAIYNLHEINTPKSWVASAKFNSKGKLFTRDGKEYELIEKKERTLTTSERVRRGFIGTLAVIGTLGFGLFNKNVKQLFTAETKAVRFGIIKLKDLEVGDDCLESSPCQHDCTFVHKDGSKENVRLNAIQIAYHMDRLEKKWNHNTHTPTPRPATL